MSELDYKQEWYKQFYKHTRQSDNHIYVSDDGSNWLEIENNTFNVEPVHSTYYKNEIKSRSRLDIIWRILNRLNK